MLILDRPASSVPTTRATLSAASSLADKLALAVVFNEQGGAYVYSAVDGASGTLSGTTPPSWSHQRLFFTYGTGLTSYVDFGAHAGTANLGNNEPVTLLMRVVRHTPVNGCALAERNDGNTVGAGWLFGSSNGGGLRLDFEATSVNAKAQSANGSLNQDMPTIVGFSTDGTLNGAMALWARGRKVLSAWATNGSGSRVSDATQSLRIGNASFNDGFVPVSSFGGWMEWVYIWRRFLRDDEVLALETDPYALFAVSGVGIPLVSAGVAPAAGFNALLVAP